MAGGQAMNDGGNAMTGGQLIVESLIRHGADTMFTVPGESFLATLDAVYETRGKLRLVVCRQEGGMAYMADTYGKLTGRPGICIVTRGPGAANAALGLHTAQQDATPLILFVGQVPRRHLERGAYQEVDFHTMFAPLAKWVGQITDPARVPEYVSRAFHTAVSGRPGPVVLTIPEDMQRERAAAEPGAPFAPPHAAPRAEDMAAVAAALEAAERPLVLVGGSGWTKGAWDDLRIFAEARALPVVTGHRRQDLIDHGSASYVGTAGLGMLGHVADAIAESDLLIVIGQQLNEVVTRNYELVALPQPRQRLVHIHPSPEEIGRLVRAEIGIAATLPEACAALAALPPLAAPRWAARTERLRAALEESRHVAPPARLVDFAAVIAHLNEALPEDAILTNGPGTVANWVHRFVHYRGYASQLAPVNGAMGYAVPSAVAAKIVHPDRVVVSLMGDGDFVMTGQELSTAMQERANVILIVVDNGMYGSQRQHQERYFPGHVIGSAVHNPDFAMIAKAYGAHGETVERTEDFPAAFERALAAGTPAVIALKTDPDQLSPTATVESVRAGGAWR
jgi:acetolactate synthase-1/2/3 large subunit